MVKQIVTTASAPQPLGPYSQDVKVGDPLFVVDQGPFDPIINEISHMLPDELREGKEDVPFLEKWRDQIPAKTLQEGKPFNLKIPS